MLANYLKIAIRNITRHKGYAFVNTASLAIGIAGCLLITMWVLDELSFDDFHENAPNLYRVEQDQFYSGERFHVNVTPHPLVPALSNEIPEITDATRYYGTGGLLFRYGDQVFFEDGIRAVDPAFLRMFTFPVVQGDPTTALEGLFSIVLTEEIAKKYFAQDDPLGKIITVDNQYEFTVTAVIEDVPNNSYLTPEMLVPYDFLSTTGRNLENWQNNSSSSFVQLHPEAHIADVNQKITDLRFTHVTEAARVNNPSSGADGLAPVPYMLRPYLDIHLYGYFGYGTPSGDIQYVYMFSAIALFVLVIACINFMNLATARATDRAKEVGLRKVVGAVKRQLVGQFYAESILYCLVALLLALALVQLLLPWFNTLAGKEMTFDLLHDKELLLGLIGITMLTGLVSGSYPALFLSTFQPVHVLKGSFRSSPGSATFRKTLVVLQFALSIFLVIGTGVVYNQLEYIRNKNLGFDKEHLMTIPLRGDIRQSYEALKTELEREPGVLSVTGTGQLPSYIGSNSSASWDGKDPEQTLLVSQNTVDYGFVETMKLQIENGRDFSEDFPTDEASSFLINQELVKIMGVPSPIGMNLKIGGREGTIVGVMNNFHFQSLRNTIEPIALTLTPGGVNHAMIRLRPDDIAKSVEAIERIWRRVIPQYPFAYAFLDTKFDEMYRSEARMGSLLNAFASFAVVVACLGLFGLASFTADQRKKEIGVRKVLGASVSQVTVLLCRQFAILVGLASLIAWPMAYFVMQNWLDQFAYQSGLKAPVFIIAAALALVVALLTVGYQAIRAALLNPVMSLRSQ